MFAVRMSLLGLAVFAAAFGAATAGAAKTTPVEKVVDLLKKLEVQLTAEGKEEAAQYDKYACFCKEQADEKQYNIEKSTKKIAVLTAEINELDAEISKLNTEIQDLEKDISALETEIADLTAAREKDHGIYEVAEADAAGAIKALKGAIEALEESKDGQDEDSKVNLVQVGKKVMGAIARSHGLVPSAAHLAAVQSLVQMGQSPPAYEYRSNDILGTLKGLLNEKFIPHKKELDTAEFEAQAAFEKRTLNLKNEKKFAEKDKAEKEEVVGKKEEEKEAATADKLQESNDMASDQSFLDEVTQECEEKATLWDQRSKARAGEMTALSQALEALESGAVEQYNANEKLVGLQRDTKAKAPVVKPFSGPASFLQLRRRGAQQASTQSASEKIADMMDIAAKRLNSQVLSLAALRVRATEDHFVKVRQLIKDLVKRLEDAAKEEASQKSFCDKHMAEAISARDKSQAEIESIAATQTELTAEKDMLTKKIAELSKEIAQEKKALLEATELRSEESKENTETINTATEGKAATELALQVLSDFYNNAKASLIQTGKYVPPGADRSGKTVSDRAPEIFDDKYGGDQQASKGIVGLLEVIISDFERTISETEDEEKTASEAFNAFKGDAEASIDTKTKSKQGKEDRVSDIEDTLVEKEGEMKDEKELLDGALKTLSKLEEKCVQGEETYAERVAKRRKEIEALKEALATLESWQK